MRKLAFVENLLAKRHKRASGEGKKVEELREKKKKVGGSFGRELRLNLTMSSNLADNRAFIDRAISIAGPDVARLLTSYMNTARICLRAGQREDTENVPYHLKTPLHRRHEEAKRALTEALSDTYGQSIEEFQARLSSASSENDMRGEEKRLKEIGAKQRCIRIGNYALWLYKGVGDMVDKLQSGFFVVMQEKEKEVALMARDITTFSAALTGQMEKCTVNRKAPVVVIYNKQDKEGGMMVVYDPRERTILQAKGGLFAGKRQVITQHPGIGEGEIISCLQDKLVFKAKGADIIIPSEEIAAIIFERTDPKKREFPM